MLVLLYPPFSSAATAFNVEKLTFAFLSTQRTIKRSKQQRKAPNRTGASKLPNI